jgi:hypothetical protein
MFLYFLHGLLLFYPPYFKCNSSTMHHGCNVFCEGRVWAWKYELWTLCINTQGHYSLASRLMLHNLQHNTTQFICFLCWCLDCWASKFAWTICTQAPQAPQMGVLKLDHLVCYLPTFDGSRGILSFEQIGKLSYFNCVFFFPFAHLCHYMFLMKIVNI